MPWKLDESKNVAVNEKGDPIWLTDDGEEKSVDYPSMKAALSTANREAAERKAELREMKGKFKPLEGIEDLEAWFGEANKALETVKTLPDKDKAVEERIRAQVEASTKPLNDKLAKLEQQKQEADARLQRETVGNAFSRSEFVRSKLVDPVLASDLFSKHFSLNQDGKLIATGPDGQTIYGESGEAGFDEALAKLVDAYPGKNHLLKGSAASGGGANPAKGGPGSGQPKSLTECKSEAEQIAYLKQVATQTP